LTKQRLTCHLHDSFITLIIFVETLWVAELVKAPNKVLNHFHPCSHSYGIGSNMLEEEDAIYFNIFTVS
jgi:hypothetical protein